MVKMTKLQGVDGLLVAIIYQAQKDATSKNRQLRQDATDYFKSDVYRQHLELLDLPVSWLPVGVVCSF